MDTWIVLANEEVGGRHRRGLYVLKSRGMAHSNELREFVLTDHGLQMLDDPVSRTGPVTRTTPGRMGRHAGV